MSPKTLKIAILLTAALAVTSCSRPLRHGTAVSREEAGYEVFVIQQRWHTGIVFHIDDIDPGIWPEIINYRPRNFIDVGWGDERFYQAVGDPVLLALRSMLFPTRPVLQVYAFNTPLHRAYAGGRILRIPVTADQLEALTEFVSERYIRDDDGNIQPSLIHGPSDYFFLATGRYHIFNTCNTWVVRAFSHAGFSIRKSCVLNANQVFKQLSRISGAAFVTDGPGR